MAASTARSTASASPQARWPEWFDSHVDEFDQLLEDVRFAPPEGYLEDE